MRAFADALDVVPLSLAENSGLAPIESLTEVGAARALPRTLPAVPAMRALPAVPAVRALPAVPAAHALLPACRHPTLLPKPAPPSPQPLPWPLLEPPLEASASARPPPCVPACA